MSSSKSPDKKQLTNRCKFIDLDEIVQEWAWQRFHATRGKEERKIELEDVHIEVNWKDAVFDQFPAVFDNDKLCRLPRANILFKTSFVNATDGEQEYSLQTNRTTRSTCEVELSQAFTRSAELTMKLTLPGGVLETNAGFRMEQSLSKSSRQTLENEVSWGVDTTVRVKPKHRAVAEVLIHEMQHSNAFSIHTVLTGRVRAVITHLKENNCMLRAVAGPVEKVFGQESNKEQMFVEDKAVHMTTRGKMALRFGVEQTVTLTQEAI